MKQFRNTALLLIVIATVCGFSTVVSAGMRCGKDLVDIGDSAYILELRCGAPVAKNHIGYTINEEQKRELLIEQWVFGPQNGYYYIVTVIGGKVSDIRSERM